MLTSEQKKEILGQILNPRWDKLFDEEREVLLKQHYRNLAAAREYINTHGVRPTDPALLKALDVNENAQKDERDFERMARQRPYQPPEPKSSTIKTSTQGGGNGIKQRSELELSVLGPLLNPDWDTLPTVEQKALVEMHDASLALVDLRRILPSEKRPLPDDAQMQAQAQTQLIEATVRHAMEKEEARQIASAQLTVPPVAAAKPRSPEEIEILGRLLASSADAWAKLPEGERNTLIARHNEVIRVCKALESMTPGSPMARLAASGTTAAERIIAQQIEEEVKKTMTNTDQVSNPSHSGTSGINWQTFLNLPPDYPTPNIPKR